MTTPTSSAPRASLTVEHLARLAAAGRDGGQPAPLFTAVEAVAAQVVGFKLFTIMRFDSALFEVERLHTNMPEIYPLGGRKRKRATAWGAQVLERAQVFRADDAEGLRRHFDDHERMIGLGLGSILNIPLAYDGRCVGTMNLTHVAGHYREEDEALGLSIGSFLLPALLSPGGYRAVADARQA